MCVRDIEFAYVFDFSIECWNCCDSEIYIFHFIIDIWKKNSWVAIIKQKYGCDPSSVIKIVKMNYNRIGIKWWLYNIPWNYFMFVHHVYDLLLHHVHDLLLQQYFTQVYIFFPILVKGLYQTESYSLHVMQLVRIETHRWILSDCNS